jgi:MFS family permease
MQMVSPAEAFGGRWAASPLSWLVLLLPTTLLVVIQDTATPFPSPAYLLASALLQHLAGGGLAVALVTVLRAFRPIIPIPAMFAIWALGGVVRGLVGGAFASAFEGVQPEYVYRVCFWVVAAVVWMPLFTYLFAQLDSRRVLLAEFESITARLEQEQERARSTTSQLRNELVTAVRDAVGPLVADVRERLSTAAEQDGEIPLGPISQELESIATEASSIVTKPVDDVPLEQPLPPLHWAPTLEALTFDRSRPVFATLLTLLAVAPLMLPDSFRLGGPPEALECVITLVTGGFVMWLGLRISRRAREFTIAHAAMIFAAAGLAALAVLLAIETYPLDQHDVAIAVAIPVWFAGSAAILSAEVGIAVASVKLIPRLEERRAELHTLLERSRAREDEIKAQVAQLLHGPILGRLSACIMALNFFLAEPEHKRGLRRTATTEGVLAHLRLVSVDLEQLSRSRW